MKSQIRARFSIYCCNTNNSCDLALIVASYLVNVQWNFRQVSSWSKLASLGILPVCASFAMSIDVLLVWVSLLCVNRSAQGIAMSLCSVMFWSSFWLSAVVIRSDLPGHVCLMHLHRLAVLRWAFSSSLLSSGLTLNMNMWILDWAMSMTKLYAAIASACMQGVHHGNENLQI